MSPLCNVVVAAGHGEHDGCVEVTATRTRWPHRRVLIRMSQVQAASLARMVLDSAGISPAEPGMLSADDWAAMAALTIAAGARDTEGVYAILRGTATRTAQLLTCAVMTLRSCVLSDMTPEQFRVTVEAVRHGS